MSDEQGVDEKAVVPVEAQYVSAARIAARDRFAEEMGMARALVESECFPDCDTPAKAYAKIRTGIDLGLTPSAAMRQIYIIPQAKGTFTLALAADLLVGLVKRRGNARFEYERDLKNGSVTLTAKRLDTDEEFVTTWDRERVERTGIAKGREGTKKNWATFEIEMMKHRADSEACRALWPDVVGGLYSVEELPPVEAEIVEPPESHTEIIKRAIGAKALPEGDVVPDGVPGPQDAEQSGAPDGEAGADEPEAEGGATDDDSKTLGVPVADAPEPRPVPEDVLAALEQLEKNHSGAFDAACAEHGLDNLELSGVSDIPEAKREAVWNAVMDALEAEEAT